MTETTPYLPYPPEPIELVGSVAKLEPLGRQHLDGIQRAVADGELWSLWYTGVPQPDNVAEWIDKALRQQAQGVALPFAIIEKSTGQIVGSSRYMNIEPDRRRLEIGTTFYSRRVQRSSINTDCKLLLLTHAFERLNCIAVEFRTHFMNFRSREAIAKLGAKQDGILRNHNQLSDGSMRDTVVFSITNHEWLAVRAHLRDRLARLSTKTATQQSSCAVGV